MSNVVAIVGRPNVGKSTLFNRLIEERKAIMDDQSGVTRDRHYGMAEWNGRPFTVIDTGGYVHGSEDVFESAIRSQVQIAVDEASILIFMVDCETGLTDLDKDFANVLRSTKKPIFIAANKADNQERALMANEFYELGLPVDIYPVSSVSGSGTGELLDELVKKLPSENPEDDGQLPKISILGRPNVGKSSFVNALLGTERSIVTDIAGTTRDSINSRYKMYGKDFLLIDTAGIRKKSKVHEDVEFYSVMRSIKALEESDVCIVMVDATRGFESQDMSIIALAHKYKKGVVMMVNKWDTVEKNTSTADEWKKSIYEKLGEMTYIPIIFTSVLTKQRVFQAIELAMSAYDNLHKKISTSKLNDALLPDIEKYPPPSVKGKYIRIKYITQLPTKTPAIAFFCNLPQYIKKPYERYLENKLRSHFDFSGVPLQIFFRKK
ncbi:MAG: ribosome biogenesis GTPase Der [Bacteroidota bacterium]